MPTHSLFTSMTGLYLVRTLWHGAAQTIHATPHPYRGHGTARHGTGRLHPPPPTHPQCTTQHKTTQRNATQKEHNTTQHNTTQHNTTQHNTTHNTTQHNTTQHNTTQHNTNSIGNINTGPTREVKNTPPPPTVWCQHNLNTEVKNTPPPAFTRLLSHRSLLPTLSTLLFAHVKHKPPCNEFKMHTEQRRCVTLQVRVEICRQRGRHPCRDNKSQWRRRNPPLRQSPSHYE